MIFTLPNILTAFRLVAGPLGALFLWWGLNAADNEGLIRWWSYALALFLAGAATDFLDGWLARRLGQVSAFGALLDPIADKVFVGSYLLVLAIWSFEAFSLWIAAALVLYPVVVIILRDVGLTWLRLSRLGREANPLPVTFSAKVKTAAEFGSIGWFFFLPVLGQSNSDWSYIVWIIMLWAAALLSLHTGLQYLKALRKTSSG